MNEIFSPALVSLDLDNLWAYMKGAGDPRWHAYPCYLEMALPHILNCLEKRELKITFFIVGRDAAQNKNRGLFREITRKGHEPANHSYSHDPWLTEDLLEEEIIRADAAIAEAAGIKPQGFRGPGFSISGSQVKVLEKLNYAYDSSLLPTFIGPLARLYFFSGSSWSKEEKKKKNTLFGPFRNGFYPIKPFYWKISKERSLLEIPVSTTPFLKTPFHLSYLHYLYGISPSLMRSYFKTALTLCHWTKTSPNFLLHPTDFLGGDKVPELAHFPGMGLETAQKIAIFDEVMGILGRNFQPVRISHMLKMVPKRLEELPL